MNSIGNPDYVLIGHLGNHVHQGSHCGSVETVEIDDLDQLDVAERAEAFQRRFREAFRDLGGGDSGADDTMGGDDSFTAAQLLAAAQQPTGLPSPVNASEPVPVTSAAVDAMVTAVTEYIQNAIRSEAVPHAGNTFNLSVTFADDAAAELGITGISLVVTATSLDVVLQRMSSDVSDELTRAAKTLAERLVTRLSKRTVRILDGRALDAREIGGAADAGTSIPFGSGNG